MLTVMIGPLPCYTRLAMSIYRTYRPTKFLDVTGQAHVVGPIQHQLERNQLAHAYLFSGPRGVGKTTVARLLAKAANCTERNGAEACGACTACEAIANGSAMDVVEVDAASHTGVDNVRENIIENVRFAPAALKKKIFIIDEVHMLSKGAFNALLKTLEEPPAYALFILATTELYKVPETIVSRCERYDFTTIPAEQIIERLKMIAKAEKVKVDAAVLEEIARRSEGCARDAETLLGQVLALGEKQITLEVAQTVMPMVDMAHVLSLLASMVQSDVAAGLRTVEIMTDRGVDMKTTLDELLALLRSVLLSRVGDRTLAGTYTKEHIKEIDVIVSGTSVDRLRALLDLVLKAIEERREFTVPSLALELMLVDACVEPENRRIGELENVRTPNAHATLPDGPGARVVEAVRVIDTAPVVIPTIPPTIVATMSEPTTFIALETIKKHWPTFQKNLRARHASLPLALEASEPIRVEGNMVMVKVAFEFYAETVNQSKNNQFLGTMLSEILGQSVGIQALFQNVATEPSVLRVLEAFGGEVVG